MYAPMMLAPEQILAQALLAQAVLAEAQAQAQAQMQQAEMMPQTFDALSPFAAAPTLPAPQPAPIGLGALLRKTFPQPIINCWGGVSKDQFDLINARRTGAALLPFGAGPEMAPFAADQELAPMFVPPTAQQMLAMQQLLASILQAPTVTGPLARF